METAEILSEATPISGITTTSPAKDSKSQRSQRLVSVGSQETEKVTATSHSETIVVQEEETVVLTENDCPEALATTWPSWTKWMILIIIFIVQTSMNLNASLYSNGQSGISEQFSVAPQIAVSGAALFLVTYAFGCELWAPWSEEFGRKAVLQLSLLMVNICCIPVLLAHYCNYFPLILIGRSLGGLFSAGGSVTLGIAADMFMIEDQEDPLAFIVLSSVSGSIIGPIIGGFIEQNLHWTWTIWIQLIFGIFAQVLHFFYVPETRASALLQRHAKKLRASGERPNVYGPDELKTKRERYMPKELLSIWARPFKMLVTERIVLILSLLSGFSDGLVFMQIQSLGLVFQRWNFSTIQVGLAFIPIGVGYVLAYLCFPLVTRRNRALRTQNPACEKAQYESRLWMLMITAPMLPIGMLIVAWGSIPMLPVHWIIPMIGLVLVGIANYGIYLTTIDYMVAAYGPYSASATGGNGFSRDLIAGALTWAARPYYEAFSGTYGLQWANTVMAGIAVVLTIAAFRVYRRGSSMRKSSPFAESLRQDDDSSRSILVAPPRISQL